MSVCLGCSDTRATPVWGSVVLVKAILLMCSPPSPPPRAGRFRVALVQMAVGANKANNLRRACQMVKEAVRNGAGVVVLPVRRGGALHAGTSHTGRVS